jgi:D-glycero-beta-D-manno-heptose 1-phosphate adenylyltransferase
VKKKSLSSKILSPLALQRATAKKKLIFTNGCFDLLHKGHVHYLEKASRLGDFLVVALNTDASVKRIKGKGRPLNALRDRLEVLAALESVDYVTWFAQDTPLSLIRKLKPQVLVKGGDWKAHQIVGAHDVLSWGGKVFSLAFVRGQSTTKLIARARQNSD